MIDMLRDMIHDLRARVEALEAQAPRPQGPLLVSTADGGPGDTIQPDDPTNEDDNG